MKRIIALILIAAALCGCEKTTEQINVELEPTTINVETEPLETNPTETAPVETVPLETVPAETVGWEIPDENYVIDLTHAAETDLELIAWVIYTEQGSDDLCDDCRRRVADTVLNMMECKITNTGNDYYWPDTIKGVISSGAINPYQNMNNSTCWPEQAHLDRERHSVERAYRIAYEVLTGNHSEIYRKGYFYYAGANVYGSEPDTAIRCCETWFMRLRDWDNSKFEQEWVDKGSR